jgi:adhesin/invasin
VHLVDPGVVTADGKRISLTVVVVDSDGSLAEDARFRGSAAKVGRFDPSCASTHPGIYSCEYTAPDRVASNEQIRIKVKLPSGVSLEGRFPVALESSGRARITTSASPKSITLTVDPSSQLSFTIRDSSGAPVSDVDLRAKANIGAIEDLHSTGAGTWVGRFVPYKATERPFPQIAIISVWDARAPGGSQDFQILPLVGRVTFPVNTGTAGAQVVFEVGGKTFPQVTADGKGQALVPITVPPGVSTAKVELIQPGGSRSNQSIDLMVPPFGRIGLGGLPDFLPADGSSTARVRMMVVDGKGRPTSGEKVLLEANVGTVSEARFLGDGIYEAKFTAPLLTAAGSATIKASIDGESGVSQVSELTSNTKRSKLSGQITGPDGQPGGKGYSVELRTASGPLRKVAHSGSGSFSADLAVDWKQSTRVQAIARMRGNKQATKHLLLLPMLDSIVTNQKTPITVLSLDQYGNPVSSVAVNCSATGGGSVTTSAQTDAFGMTTVVFTASALGGYATVSCEGAGAKYIAPLWQSPDAMPELRFPVAGGQTQGSLLARWSKLRAHVDLSQAKAVAVVAEPKPEVKTTEAAAAWGQAPTGTAKDSGSVAKAGAPTEITVAAIPAALPDMGGTVSLVVRVTDSAGTLIPGTNVILITDVGSVSGKTDNGDGTFSATLTVPAKSGRERVQITATRPAGDIAGFATVAIGGGGPATAATGKGKKPKAKAKVKAKGSAAAPSADRMAHRVGRVWVGWTPGSYTYSGTPCSEESGPCEAPADTALESFDFLKTEIEAPTVGSFSVGGEWFPFQDYVAIEAEYTRAAYTTDFQAQVGEGESHCATHFCDSMNYINVGALGRFALLKDKGPLDLLVRTGVSIQDVTVFWRRPDAAGEKEARFETINLVGLRVGAGMRYTVTPKIQPHVDYNLTFGLRATLGDSSFGVPGVINHNVVGGVTFFPWKGLMLDASYTMLSRSLGLSFEEAGVIQRGSLTETTHSLRLSAGWAF